MSAEAFRLRELATNFQTHDILFKMNKLSEDVILVILQYLEFARPDVPPRLVNDLKIAIRYPSSSETVEKETSVHNEGTRSYFGLGHIRGFKHEQAI